MADGTVIGLTLAKVNGIYNLDVRNSRWSTKRQAQQHVTGGGVKIARGQEIPSGSFGEVIPREKQFDWRSLSDFSVEIYDKETRGIVVASFTGCEWDGLDGNSDLSSANTTRDVTWKGRAVVKS